MARTLLASLFAIGLTAVAVPTPAQAACDDTYEPVCVQVDISDVTQIGGRDIVVSATARTSNGDPVQCDWSVSFSGESAPFVNKTNTTGSGSTFNRTFTTEEVDEDLQGSATATCTYDDATVPVALGGTAGAAPLGFGGTSRLSAALISALQNAGATGQVNLLTTDDDGDDDDDSDDSDDSDDGDDDDGGLPDTGGERLLWLLIGLALVAGGTTVIVSSRNRDASA